MTNTLDIFNPQISKIAEGLEGKVITVYGRNNLGKTKQASRMKKPLYLPLEKGLNAIAGIPFMPVNNWSDFKKVTKQLSKNPQKVKEVYQTIIIDSLDAFAKYATRYVCNRYDVERLKDGNDGFGLWSEYATEVWEEVDKLVKSGLTIVFIGHAKEDKDGKIRPKGDDRTLAPVIDNSDFVVYLESNGVDEEGQVIKSSAYFAETSEFFARSRFTYIDTYLQEFTAENLEEVISKAIEREEEETGIKTVTYEEQVENNKSVELDYDTLMKQIKLLGKEIAEQERMDDLNYIVKKHLGEGKKVTECRPEQVEVMSIILDELQDFLENIPEED